MNNDERQVFSVTDVPIVRPPQPGQSTITVDMTGVNSAYTNWYKVVGTPEEVVVDFGMNLDHGSSVPAQPVKIGSRVVMSLYTAKRLVGHLTMAIQRHEAHFGVIETEMPRRARPIGDGKLTP